VEQAEVIAAVNRPFFLGGTFLPLSVMSEEVATVFANPVAARLVLGAGPISDSAFKILVDSPVRIELPDTASLSDEQVRIMAAAVDRVPGGQFRGKLSVPMVTTLDSALLAETLLRSAADGLFGVTSISPAAAEALGRVPEAAAGKPDAGLNFPGLVELTPETARLLMNRRWAGISLGAREAAPETVRRIVRQSSNVSLGLTAITPEVAALIPCGVMTGYGAVHHVAKVEKGSSVLVFGMGSIGLNVLQASRLAGAASIIAIDTNPTKEGVARAFGATHFLNSKEPGEPLDKRVKSLLGGFADHAFDCVGHPAVVRQALSLVNP
jgi:hypothetical protein